MNRSDKLYETNGIQGEKMNRSTEENNENADLGFVQQQPHTIRLLRLIQQGPAEHSQEAAAHLSYLARTSFSPIQLWDILGQLQESLCSADWRVRTNVAFALEGVAKCLPESDQYDFLTRRNEKDVAVNFPEKSEKSDAGNIVSYLTISDLIEAELLETILSDGRLLLSSSASRYDELEEEMVAKLDSAMSTNENLSNSTVNTNDFVEERMQLQRRIMAKRLGLLDLGDAIGDFTDLVPIKSNDILASSSSVTTSVTSKRQMLAADLQRKKQRVDEKKESQITVRSLLPFLMEQTWKKSKEGGNGSSHNNPQTLLASELIYRMLDPCWYIRHGAILGISSLLRAWKSTVLYQRKQKREDYGLEKLAKSDTKDSYFGSWPHDILVRCICVLALDRFGDFSGLAIDDVSFNKNDDFSGTVVAPVREVAGQLLTLLLAIAPTRVKNQTFEILTRLINNSQDWEIRHGALVALRFMACLLPSNTLLFQHKGDSFVGGDRNVTKELCWYTHFIESTMICANTCLSDSCDDVKGVAAHLLKLIIEYLKKKGSNSDFNEKMNMVWNLVPDTLWSALRGLKPLSSATVDLVSLLALMMDVSPSTFLAATNGNSILQYLNHVTDLALHLLDSDFVSVQISSLQYIGSFAKSFADILSAQDEGRSELQVAAKHAYGSFACRLFDLLHIHWSKASSDDVNQNETYLTKRLNDVAICLFDAGDVMLHHDQRFLKDLESELLLKYFNVHKPRTTSTLNDIEPSIQAAKVLSRFIYISCGKGRINRHILNVVRIALRSPWASHCEQACFLYRSLASRFGDEYTIVNDFHLALNQLDSLECFRFSTEENQALLENDTFKTTFDSYFAQSLNDDMPDAITNTEEIANAAIQGSIPVTPFQPCKKLSLMRMRVEATIAGATLVMPLPFKVTPLVRAFVTSFKNESESKSRLAQTCLYLTELLQRLHKQEKYANAQGKILSILCDRAVEGGHLGSYENPGSIVLQSLIRGLTYNETLKDIVPLWHRLSPFFGDADNDVDNYRNVLCLVKVLARAFTRNCKATSDFIDCFLPTLVMQYCENPNDQVKKYSTEIVDSICGLDPLRVLTEILPTLTKYLRQFDHRFRRISACRLLRDVVLKSGKDICPFIQDLIPLVLSLMTDTANECSLLANSIFAALVQFAPLVRESASRNVSLSDQDEEKRKVIDHLIFGKPLPSCSLPQKVRDSLQVASIKLRNYQSEGVTWLRFLQTVKVNGALCDSMGLGKTLQALVAVAMCRLGADALDNKRNPRSLVICPSTVVGHWISEIHKTFPGNSIFRPLSLTGTSSVREGLWQNGIEHCNIVVTSYTVLRSDVEKLKSEDWCYCILDEGHLLKNPKTATARAAKSITACHKLILTGTPIQNKVDELWAIFDFLIPNYLGSAEYFTREFANPIAKSCKPNATASCLTEGTNKLKILHQKVLPFILRREKDQVLQDLPPKNLITIGVAMSSMQARLYEEFSSNPEIRTSLHQLEAALKGTSDDLLDKIHDTNNSLRSLLLLRLLCTHPSLVISEEKALDLGEIWHDHSISGKLSALVQLLREGGIYHDTVTAADNDYTSLYCNDDTEDSDSFFKISNAVESFDFAKHTDKQDVASKFLIFCQFNKSLDFVEKMFMKLLPSLRYLRLDGRVPMNQRNAIAEKFNQDASIKVMLLTTRVGGLGLNLTGANVVVFLEMDYNPFSDLQAMDRAHRIGQKNSIDVYRLVTKDSVEEKILELQNRKVTTSNAIVNTDNSSMYSMGTDRLLDIFHFEDKREETEVFDLDSVVDRCAEDYMSLTVKFFSKELES